MNEIHVIFANVVWPALVLEGRLLSIPVILSGLIIEYFFICRITELRMQYAIYADAAMNAASTLLGIVLIPIVGIIWEFFPGLLIYEWFNVGTFNPGTWIATFCFAVIINAALETFVLVKFFKQKMGKPGFAWLCVANALSVGIAFGSFLVYPMSLN